MLKQVRAAEGNDLLVVCTCGKTTILKFDKDYKPIDKTWKHDQHGWNCGKQGHQQFFSKFTWSK